MWVIGLLHTPLVLESLSVQHVHKASSWEGERRGEKIVVCRVPSWLSSYGSSLLVSRKVGVAFYFREMKCALLSRCFEKQSGKGCCRGLTAGFLPGGRG